MSSKNLFIRAAMANAVIASVLFTQCAHAVAGPSEKVLHSFNVSTQPGGSGPQGNLVFDTAGNLYGTTYYGGISSGQDCSDAYNYGCGTAFELIPKAGGGWTEKLLHNFGDVGDGSGPYAGMIIDSVGNLYGTTYGGGPGGCGTVFELMPGNTGGTWTEKLLHGFCTEVGDGSEPTSTLVFDAVGNLYGTTGEGGTGQCSCGVAFELMPQADGSWTEKVLHNFGNSGDGSGPIGGLVFDAAGNLYGTTGSGGSDCYYGFGCGVVFELIPGADGSWSEKLLYIFTAGEEDLVGEPDSTMIFDKAGNLYGTTTWGPGVFELTPNAGGSWTEKAIELRCCYPNAVTMRDGNIYGAYEANSGGRCCGSVFELQPRANGTWTETVLYSFGNGQVGSGKNGAYPSSGLIFDSAGHLYGTTAQGGFFWLFNSGEPTGTVFEIAP